MPDVFEGLLNMLSTVSNDNREPVFPCHVDSARDSLTHLLDLPPML